MSDLYNLKQVEASQRLPAGNIRSAAQVGVFPSPDQKENFESRIEGGEKGFIQQFPWIASLHVRKAHQCTGSLFSNQWILTAGHCRKASKTPRKVSHRKCWDENGSPSNRTLTETEKVIGKHF